MNKILTILIMMALMSAVTVPAFAAVYDFNAISDSATVGDFLVSGNDVASGTGQNFEVLKFNTKYTGGREKVYLGTSFDGAAAGDTAVSGLLTANDQGGDPHSDVVMGPLWESLDDYGINEAYNLVFGFDMNQSGSSSMTIEALTMDFGGGNVFSLGDNAITVNEYNGNGSALAELKFQVTLPYNFMTQFNASSTADFYIESTYGEGTESGGFDEYFLSAVFTCDANDCDIPPPPPTVPEPASMFLLGSGLLGFAGLRRKK